MRKKQIFIVHGGMTFKNQRDYTDYLKNRPIRLEKKISWSDDYLEKKLGKTFDIIKPRMPLQDNAKYADWKIWFERFIPHLKPGFVLVGNSLGGIFLAKYLSENKLPRKAHSVFLVCPPFDNSLPEEDLVGGFRLKGDLSLLPMNTKHLRLLFSKDDPVVLPSQAEKYRKKLPDVEIIMYGSKNGHFFISEFPEIIKMIKEDMKKK